MIEKVELRSDDDSVKFILLMPEWFQQIDEGSKLEIITGLKQYTNMFAMMIQSEENMIAFNLIMAKGLLNVCSEILTESLKRKKKQ